MVEAKLELRSEVLGEEEEDEEETEGAVLEEADEDDKCKMLKWSHLL